jgi:putative membrane protein
MTELNSYINTIRDKSIFFKVFLIVFYSVGILGLLWPLTHLVFIRLIPTALLLSFGVLLLFHKNSLSRRFVWTFSFVYIFSFFIEAMGVSTGIIFGGYHYGNSLGIKLFNTPMIIGLNWVFLVYTSASLVNHLKLSGIFSVLLASLVMVLYDIVMEQVASLLDMWYWKDNQIPLQNYISWFACAVLFHSLLKVMHIKTQNKMATTILSCQFLFFLVLMVFNKLSI